MGYDLIGTQLPDEHGLVVAFDCEASGLFVDDGARVSIVSVAWYDQDGQLQSRAFPFDQGLLDKPAVKGIQPTLFDEAPNLGEDAWRQLCDWLQRQWLTAHNIKYDLSIMRAGHRRWGAGVDLSNRIVWCSLVTAPFFFPNQSIALKSICAQLFGDEERDAERQLHAWLNKHKDGGGNKRFDLAPWSLVGPYASKDAEQAIHVYAYQQAMLDSGEVPEPYELIDREIDLALCLYRMEGRGVRFDAEACRQAAQALRQARNQVYEQLRTRWRREPTPAAARWWFFDQLDQEPLTVSEHGTPSVDSATIAELTTRGAELAAEYGQLAAYGSALSKWYDNWPELCGSDGRLRPSYHQTKQPREGNQAGRGTVSGRLAVERVQLQAVPHDFRLPEGVPSIRSMFKAAPGYDLWEVDISQAEVRVATLLSKCEPMRQILASGGDLHGQVAQRVFGVDQSDSDWSTWRTLGKRLTFAMLYAAGAATFCRTLREQAGIDVSLHQAREWLHDYRTTFPQFVKLHRKAEQEVNRWGYVELVTGRRRWFSPFERAKQTSKAMNQKIQGSVAEGMKLIKVEVEYQHPNILLNEIHDSLMLEVPAGQVGAAKIQQVEELMVKILQTMFGGWDAEHPIPWAVDSKIWGDAE